MIIGAVTATQVALAVWAICEGNIEGARWFILYAHLTVIAGLIQRAARAKEG